MAANQSAGVLGGHARRRGSAWAVECLASDRPADLRSSGGGELSVCCETYCLAVDLDPGGRAASIFSRDHRIRAHLETVQRRTAGYNADPRRRNRLCSKPVAASLLLADGSGGCGASAGIFVGVFAAWR